MKNIIALLLCLFLCSCATQPKIVYVPIYKCTERTLPIPVFPVLTSDQPADVMKWCLAAAKKGKDFIRAYEKLNEGRWMKKEAPRLEKFILFAQMIFAVIIIFSCTYWIWVISSANIIINSANSTLNKIYNQ